MKRPLILIIMDGFGNNSDTFGNAITAANTTNLDNIIKNNPTTYINSSGTEVGLPIGQMGNSEVGHTNIGAGRVVYQELVRITKSINEKEIYNNIAIKNTISHCKENNSNLHLIGLLSDGGVHSHINHLIGLLKMIKSYNFKNIYIHPFLDGRDVSPTSGVTYIQQLEYELTNLELGKIATISGRYYAMDRDNAWDRTQKCYDAMVLGKGISHNNPIQAIKDSYSNNVTDEFFIPTVFDHNGIVKSNDGIISFNFRPDRARQITRAFVDPEFNGFNIKNQITNLYYTCMTQYDSTMPNVSVAFTPQTLNNTFGEFISKQGLTQLRIAETQKYAHVTFFFNGGVEKIYEGEDRILIKSPDVATFDLKPEMSAYEITDKVTQLIEQSKYDVIILNYANCDMVGHTGIFEAAKQAVEHVDKCIGRVIESIQKVNGIAIITADHGNAEKMYENEKKSPFTPHTSFPVPFIIVGMDNCSLYKDGKLADIAPTMCDILGLKKPDEMTGKSLIIK